MVAIPKRPMNFSGKGFFPVRVNGQDVHRHIMSASQQFVGELLAEKTTRIRKAAGTEQS